MLNGAMILLASSSTDKAVTQMVGNFISSSTCESDCWASATTEALINEPLIANFTIRFKGCKTKRIFIPLEH